MFSKLLWHYAFEVAFFPASHYVSVWRRSFCIKYGKQSRSQAVE
jgi:hypothetical protein